MKLYYLYLLLTFSDGTSALEAKGAAGTTWEQCIDYASYVKYQQLYPRAKTVTGREVMCLAATKPE